MLNPGQELEAGEDLELLVGPVADLAARRLAI